MDIDVLTENVPPEDLKKYETIYREQLYVNKVTPKAQFEYACCLVRSKYPADIRKGIILFEELYKSHEEGQRDYLYYLAIGNGRIKEYVKALDYIKSFLSVEPGNPQMLALQSTIRKKMEKDGLKGIAITSAAVAAVGAIGAIIYAAKKGGK